MFNETESLFDREYLIQFSSDLVEKELKDKIEQQILSQKKIVDKGPLIAVTLKEEIEPHTYETYKVAVSEKYGPIRFQTYDQISKDSPMGKWILENKDKIQPGWIWERTNAEVVSIAYNFSPNEEPILSY